MDKLTPLGAARPGGARKVERAFGNLKSVDLKIRPVDHHLATTETRTFDRIMRPKGIGDLALHSPPLPHLVERSVKTLHN